jgi:hypothetical protein
MPRSPNQPDCGPFRSLDIVVGAFKEIAFRLARIVAALAERGDAVADRVYNGPIRRNCNLF